MFFKKSGKRCGRTMVLRKILENYAYSKNILYGLRYCTMLLYPAGILSCLTAATRKGKVNNQIDVPTIMQLNNFSVLHTKRLWSRNWNKWLACSQFYNKLLLPWYQFTTAILVFLSYLKLDDKPCYVFQQSVC